MVRLLDRPGLTALRARLALVPLAAHRGLHRGRRYLDEHGGFARDERRAAEWATRWAARTASLSGWLERPGAGSLWIAAAAGARWARRLCTPGDIACAENILAGRLPLLGADPEVGVPPMWLRDGYSRREWPLLPARLAVIARGDGSDIRTVWELSRSYHFIPLARAYWRTGDARFADAFRSHVESWIRENPVGLGPNWWSPMDAAIRAANWALAAVLFANAPELRPPFWASLLANLRRTARYVERNLEWHPVFRGNHYVSNGVGLVYVGALFRDEPAGARWLRRGAGILAEEISRQVHPDGVSFESAIGYHRLVTEFFAFGGEVCRKNLPGALPESYWRRLGAMYEFMEAYLDAEGRAPLLGDADDGRLHLLCTEAAAAPRLHRLGLPRRYRPQAPPASRAFPEGGFYVLRAGGDRCIVRCGAVGLAGAGSHDHNDQLSFELVLAGREVVSDSGTYAYTRDLPARFAFRSTAAHNAIQLGLEEQNPIRADRPWRILADRTRAKCIAWSVSDSAVRFTGRHSGFAHRPSAAVCSRTIGLEIGPGTWMVEDRVDGRGREEITWRLHFAPGEVRERRTGSGRHVMVHSAAPECEIDLTAPASLAFGLEESPWSERYGVRVMRRVAVLRGAGDLPLAITFIVRRSGSAVGPLP